MKQKAGQVQAKKQTNGVQKKKAGAKTVAIQKAAPEISAKVPIISKKQQKPQKKVLPPKKVVEEEEEDDDEEEEEEGSDSGADVQELSQEVEEDDDDEEDDEEEEDDDENEEEEDSDEKPDEEPVAKKTKKVAKAGIPDINPGILPKDFPNEKVLILKNLPPKFKQVDIVEAFSKYGTIHTINPQYGKNCFVTLAFTTEEAAKAALAADQTVTINGQTISVSMRKSVQEQKTAKTKVSDKKDPESKERSVYVKNVKLGTTNDQLKEIFEEYGKVESATVYPRGTRTCAIVIYEKKEEAVESAKHLHNSVLNESTIRVFHHDNEIKPFPKKDAEHTVLLKNIDQLEYIAGEKLEKIFSTCGEIETLDILCMKNVLAFITFKSDKSAKKALKLSGTTVDGIQLDLQPYESQRKSSIFLQNLRTGATEDDLRALFKESGPIENITIRGTNAIIKFENTESYCNSFLLDETVFQGLTIFIEPYSEKKRMILNKFKKQIFGNKQRPGNNRPGNKRPAGKSFGHHQNKKQKMF